MAQTQQPLGFSGSPMTAALLGPDILARQLRIQQEQQYAQQMLEQGQQTPQGQMVSGHYVAPSITQYLANGLKSYVGRKAMNDLPNQMASLGQAQMQGVNNLFGVSAPQASAQAPQDLSQPDSFAEGASGSAPMPSSQAFPVGPSGAPPAGAGVASGSSDPASAGIVASPQVLAQGLSAQPGALGSTPSPVSPQNQAMVGALRGQQPGQPRMPLLPGKTAQESAQAFAILGPQGYMQAVITQSAPTDIVKNMIAMGVDPNSQLGRQIISANVNKANYIAPTNVRPGGTVFDNVTGKPIFTAPNANGSQIVRDANGNPSMSQVPGAQAVNVNNSVANATGPATFRTSIVNSPDGQNQMMSDVQKAGWLTSGESYKGLPSNYVNAVVSTESGGNPNAVSGKGAQGAMQVMPKTNMAPGFGVAPAKDDSEVERTRVGRDYLVAMNDRYKDPTLAAIAYNMGPGATDTWLQSGGDFSKLPAETKNYVASVMTKSAVGARSQTSMPGQPVQGEGAIATNTELGKDQAKTLIASRDAAVNATNDITNIQKARQAIASGVYGGSGAGAKLAVVKFINSNMPFITIDPAKVTNTDYLVSVLGKGLLTHAKELGYNPTDADAQRIEAIVGTIGKDPQALNKLIDYQETMANRVVQRHNQLVAQAKSNGIQSAFDMQVSPKTGMPGAEPVTNPAATNDFKIIGVR